MQQRNILDHFNWEKNKPKLYTKELVLAFTIVFSALFGAILYIHNLAVIGKWRSGIWLTLVVVIYYTLTTASLRFFSIPQFVPSLLFNIIAALILVGPVWNSQIGRYFEHQPKSPMMPLILAILVATGLLYAKSIAYSFLS